MNCLTKKNRFGSIETLDKFQETKRVIKSNRGQLSIFMGITLILVMGLLAFIINVGLFVKAKINLQNSVDAAAFSGAATQARQLTNIAYANWELRNTYKEWMFKYYILGQVGLLPEQFYTNPNVPYPLSDIAINGSENVRFRLLRPASNVAGVGTDFDRFNLPSICIHNNSLTNICPIYSLPGIPRFPAIGVAGITEIHEAFVNKLVEEKGADCSRRAQINFLAAVSWAYSSGIKEMPGAPLVATNRAGAWPESIELSMRIRNLEMIVNRPPIDGAIDFNTVNQLQSEGVDIGYNERPIKAYMSALRNLSGGAYKGTTTDEFASSFKLFELAPQPFVADARSVSGFLIPSDGVYPGGSAIGVLNKHYLDLQAVPLNFSTLFTTFASTSNQFDASVTSEASCYASKTALPVPGYILGFVKNPSVLTYYAVKGEAEFTGLFFPFNAGSEMKSIKLTAYAAAKPFGGRIGPKLFSFENADTTVRARFDENRRSNAYVSGLDLISFPEYKPGLPIPTTRDFWINPIQNDIGGVPGSNSRIYYGIPNLIYDFEKESDLAIQTFTGSSVQVISPLASDSQPTQQNKGLYHNVQIRALKKSLGQINPGGVLTSDDVMRAIVRSRRVTKYDVANYLVPDFRNSPEVNNAAPFIKRLDVPVPGNVGDFYGLFAPLIGSDLLYKTSNAVTTIVNQYLDANTTAINTYIEALYDVGEVIYNTPATAGQDSNRRAAQSIHVNVGTNGGKIPALLSGADPSDPGCSRTDLATKFYHFFKGKSTECGIVPLEVLMVEYIDKKAQDDGKTYYKTTYLNEDLTPRQTMTAYFPGPRQGVTPDSQAIATHPLKVSGADASEYSARRNFYSTKFFQMAKIMEGAPDRNNKTNYEAEPTFRENDKKSPDDMTNVIIKNPLKYDGTSGLNNKYYIDF